MLTFLNVIMCGKTVVCSTMLNSFYHILMKSQIIFYYAFPSRADMIRTWDLQYKRQWCSGTAWASHTTGSWFKSNDDWQVLVRYHKSDIRCDSNKLKVSFFIDLKSISLNCKLLPQHYWRTDCVHFPNLQQTGWTSQSQCSLPRTCLDCDRSS